MGFELQPLRNPLVLVDGETPASFVSRLAAHNLAASAAEFCADFLLDFDKIARGNGDQLAKLAWFASCDLEKLQRHAPQVRNRDIVLGHARVPYHLTTAGRLQVCPECLASDLATAPELRRDAAAAQRALWLIEPIRTCSIHSRALVQVAHRGRRRHDFALRLDNCLDELDDWFDQSPARAPSPFECYVAARVDGIDCGIELLDPLQLGDVCSISSWFGTFVLSGPNGKIVGASQDELHDATVAGFEVLKDGPGGINALVSGAVESAIRTRSRRSTPRNVLGNLYANLKENLDSTPQYTAIRTAVANSLSGHIPPNAEAAFLGVDVRGSAPLSLNALRKSTGLAINTLKRLLSIQAGANSKHAVENWRWRAVSRSEASALFGSLTSLLDSAELSARLGLARHTLVDLAEAGTLVPIEGKFVMKQLAYYREEDVADFEGRLLSKLKHVDSPSDAMASLGQASGATAIRPSDIIALILEGAIDGFITDVEPGPRTIRVSVEQIRLHLTSANVGMTTREASRILNTNEKVVGALVQRQVLDGKRIRCLTSGRWRTSISMASIEAFQASHITHSQLGRHLKLNPAQTSALLEQRGISAAIDPNHVFCRIYRRRDVCRLLD